MNHFRLTIVVVVHDMAREAPRTLLSLTPSYQRGVNGSDYEVIVMDNGSPEPLGESTVTSFGPNFRYRYIQDASPSPARALNLGVREARAGYVGLIIDGARILTPGVLSGALTLLHAWPDAAVATLGFHLGPELQMTSPERGYDQAAEDALLDGIGWPGSGYRLFEIAALAGSSSEGWLGPMSESNCLFLSRQRYRAMDGYDERFDLPGGGLVNLDFWTRLCEDAGRPLFSLLGEGSFHQYHGGAATGLDRATFPVRWKEWDDQYEAIRGSPYRTPGRVPILFGSVSSEAIPWLQRPATSSADSQPDQVGGRPATA